MDPDPELLDRQDALQREAAEVVASLGLLELLGTAGMVRPIGSAPAGLMVWRDLDFSIYCATAEPDPVVEVLRTLMLRDGVREVSFADELGPRSPSGLPKDQRYYSVLRYAHAAEVWKLDLSFWTRSGPDGEFSDPDRLRARLDDETRLAILWIKDVWHRRPEYPYEIGGIDIYDAVLNHRVRTPTEFDAYLERRQT
jgi:hypothetical protein